MQSSVASYSPRTGTLTLEHHYPPTSPTPASVPVDITLLLESIDASDLVVGAWLNVLGYVREGKKSIPRQEPQRGPHDSIYVEAVTVFPAGAFQIGEYERVLQDWIDVDRMIRRS